MAFEEFVPALRIRPEPATGLEQRNAALLAPGDYEVYSEKLNMITEEAATIFVRTGVSGMLHSGDLVVGIYTPRGDLVTASCGTHLHAVSGQIPIKFIREYWEQDPSLGVREGDVFYCNDAQYGGIHNPDQFAIMPIFSGGELVAWSAAGVHQPETGATEPGGMPVSARSRYDEGMKLPPIRIGENYRLRADLMAMMANMVRTPRMQSIDTRARVTAADRVRRRVQEFVDDKGNPFLQGLFRRIIDVTAEGARSRISSWRDATIRHVFFMDTVGYEEGLTRSVLTLRKQGDRLTFDFTGTSPENPGSYNSVLHAVIAHAAIYLYGWAFHDFPLSSGLFEPMEFTVPEGTFLNASFDAAVANAPITCTAVMHLVHVTMSKLLYLSGDALRTTAPPYNGGSGYVYAGVNQWGVRDANLQAYPLNTQGFGARPDCDGVDAFGFPWGPWGKAPDAEDVENEQPFLHLFQKLLRDSGGAGRYRGGCGTVSAYLLHHTDAVGWTSTTKGSKVPAGVALFGGYPTFSHPGIEVHDTDAHELLESGSSRIPEDVYALATERAIRGDYRFTNNVRPSRMLRRGDIFIANSYGGGGYGDPLERDPQAVADDVEADRVSPWSAENLHGVVYDGVTFRADPEATAVRRKQLREERLSEAQDYESFLSQWSALRPPEAILTHYGNWPDATPNRVINRI